MWTYNKSKYFYRNIVKICNAISSKSHRKKNDINQSLNYYKLHFTEMI